MASTNDIIRWLEKYADVRGAQGGAMSVTRNTDQYVEKGGVLMREQPDTVHIPNGFDRYDDNAILGPAAAKAKVMEGIIGTQSPVMFNRKRVNAVDHDADVTANYDLKEAFKSGGIEVEESNKIIKELQSRMAEKFTRQIPEDVKLNTLLDRAMQNQVAKIMEKQSISPEVALRELNSAGRNEQMFNVLRTLKGEGSPKWQMDTSDIDPELMSVKSAQEALGQGIQQEIASITGRDNYWRRYPAAFHDGDFLGRMTGRQTGQNVLTLDEAGLIRNPETRKYLDALKESRDPNHTFLEFDASKNYVPGYKLQNADHNSGSIFDDVDAEVDPAVTAKNMQGNRRNYNPEGGLQYLSGDDIRNDSYLDNILQVGPKGDKPDFDYNVSDPKENAKQKLLSELRNIFKGDSPIVGADPKMIKRMMQMVAGERPMKAEQEAIIKTLLDYPDEIGHGSLPTRTRENGDVEPSAMRYGNEGPLIDELISSQKDVQFSRKPRGKVTDPNPTMQRKEGNSVIPFNMTKEEDIISNQLMNAIRQQLDNQAAVPADRVLLDALEQIKQTPHRNVPR